MLKQSKGIIYVQGKETKDATLIGLSYMDKVELKNKKNMKIEDLYGREFEYDGEKYKITNLKTNNGFTFLISGSKIRKWRTDYILDKLNQEVFKLINDKQNFECLEEIEVSNDIKFFGNASYYIGKDSYDNFVVECKEDGLIKLYKHARKINHERNKAIEIIKELMKVNNIKKDELCLE